MKRKLISVGCLLSLFLLVQAQSGSLKAQNQDETTKTKVTTIVEMKPIVSTIAFRQAANLDYNVYFSPRDMTLRPTPMVAIQVSFSKESADGGGQEIWIAEPDGKQPKRVVSRVRGSIDDIQWSPDGTQLCYRVETDTPEKGLYIAEVPSGKTTQISQTETRNPQWTADGRDLLFWHISLEQKGWQAYRASDVKGAGQLTIAAADEEILLEPGVFSPDGQRWAAKQGVVVIKTLATHQRIAFSLSNREPTPQYDLGTASVMAPQEHSVSLNFMQWSGDSQWLYLEVAARRSEFPPPSQSLLLNTESGKVVSLREQSGKVVHRSEEILAHPKKGENVVMGDWMPGDGHRLFLLVEPVGLDPNRFISPEAVNDMAVELSRTEALRLIYDVDADTTQQIEVSRGHFGGGFGKKERTVWSPDGRSAWLSSGFYDFSVVY